MDNEYQWVPFYEAFADRLLEWKDRRDELYALIRKISADQPLMTYLHFEREDWWGPKDHQIDPFSVMGAMNRGTTDANRTILAQLFATTFGIEVPAPTEFAGIPIVYNSMSVFGGVDEIWDLFILAMKSAETNTFSAEFDSAFEKALAVKGNGLGYITMGLFWIRPHVFMPLDSSSRPYVASHHNIAVPEGHCSGDEYVEFLSALKKELETQSHDMSFPQLALAAWTARREGTDSRPRAKSQSRSTAQAPLTDTLDTSKRKAIRGDQVSDKNIILYGSPGTGKTYSSIQYAVAIVENRQVAEVKAEDYAAVYGRYQQYKDDGLIEFTTFHQSYGYEEFIEGIRPRVLSDEQSETSRDIEYEVHDGVFKAFCNRAGIPVAQQVDTPKRVFIIDEINRGNISKIFGELITVIEPSKRINAPEELRARLPYSGQSFGVPDNVYIVGTMNTADRSIALIDTALRRRFSFVEMRPDSAVLKGISVDSLDIAKMLDTINRRITVLFDREHTIGHSYLFPLKEAPTIDNLAGIFENKIVPLMQEYFYGDYEKIQLVLGDNQKPDDSTRFITRKTDAARLFGDTDSEFAEYYEVNKEAFKRTEAYAFLQ